MGCMSRKSWAEQNGVKVACLGDVVNENITICEENRATVYEHNGEEVEKLRAYMDANYLSKGVDAALVGVRLPDTKTRTRIYCAVFVEDGFLIDEETEDQ